MGVRVSLAARELLVELPGPVLEGALAEGAAVAGGEAAELEETAEAVHLRGGREAVSDASGREEEDEEEERCGEERRAGSGGSRSSSGEQAAAPAGALA